MRFLQSNIAAFLESSPGGDIWKVIIIEEGLSKNGKYYTKEALQRSIPLFEKSKVCFYEWKDKHFDHVPLSIEKIRPEGFPLQTAGWLDNIKYETVKVEGREVTGLTGSLHLLEGNSKVQELKQTIIDAWKKGLRNFLGLSINAEGPSSVRMLNGQPISVVSGITRVFSTDFVTQPAAGGELLKIIESLQFGGNEHMFKKFLEALKNFNTKLFESVDVANITEEEATSMFESVVKEAKEKKAKNFSELEAIAAKVKEKKYEEAEQLLAAVKKSKEAIPLSDEELLKADDASLSPEDLKRKKDLLAKQGGADAVAEAKKKQEELDAKSKTIEAKLADMEKKAKTRECKEMLQLALDESNLPMPVKNKIKKSFESKIFDEATLKESIKSERDTLAALIESGATIDLGGDVEGSYVQNEPITKLQASMDLMFGYKPSAVELKESFNGVEGFNSLREAYVAFTDDPSISGKYGPKAMARLREATESSFSYALGYSMQRRMLPEYAAIAPLWKKIAVTSNIKDFKLQERIQWGGFGVLPTVQAARTVAGTPVDSATPTYPELGFPGDSETTYAVATKGGLVTITRRMIIDDDLKILAGLPKKLGKAAAYTLNQFVFDLMLGYNASGINAATIGDSVALYATAHKNYRTGALGYDNLYDLLNDMYYQCEFGYSSLVATQLEAAGTSLVLTATTAAYFKAGDLIWLDGEICRVDASDGSATLTITRGLFGTTDAQHLVAVVVKKITQVLGLENPTLWVPRGLRGTALALKTSQKNPENAEGGDNTLRDAFEVEVSPYLRGDENNYYLSAKTSDVEGIEVGFLNGKEEPEILVQDQPTVDNVFIYDQIRYKVRHEYGGAVVDFKGFAGAIVS
jgi:hypothetical protein